MEQVTVGFWYKFNNMLQAKESLRLNRNTLFHSFSALQYELLLLKKRIGSGETDLRKNAMDILAEVVRCNRAKMDTILLHYDLPKPWSKPGIERLADYAMDLATISMAHRQLFSVSIDRLITCEIKASVRFDDCLHELFKQILSFLLAWTPYTLVELALFKYKELDPSSYEENEKNNTGLFSPTWMPDTMVLSENTPSLFENTLRRTEAFRPESPNKYYVWEA